MSIDKLYDNYWKSGLHVSKEWDDKRFKRVMAPVLDAKSILDYGCGLGHAYQRKLAEGRSYSGADVSSTALDDVSKKGFQHFAIDSGNGMIGSEDEQFDGATSVEVFEHLMDPLAAAKELFRVLRPGGKLVATVPNFGYHPWRLMALLRAEVPTEPENRTVNRHNGVHIRYFCPRTLKRLLTDAGFTDVKIDSFDDATVWDVFRGMGPLSHISDFARRHFPTPFHLRYLQDIAPSVFAYRLRAVAAKPVPSMIS
ncbi:MAG: class I SAM-dependent methyltransferase [Akkermansiaceae bacterium]